MPLSLFLTLVAIILLGNVALNGILLWLAARICKAKRLTLARAELTAVLFAVLSALVFVLTEGMRPGLAFVAVGAFSLVVQPLLLKSFSAERWPRSLGIWLLSIAFTLPATLGIAFALKLTILDSYVLNSGGMTPTLGKADRFVVDRTLMPGRWDIAVFRSPLDHSSVFAMRVVGLPGERVEIVDGEIKINETTVAKPPELAGIKYIGDRPVRGVCHGCTGSPMLLGPDEFFVLGDNSAMSNDSRYWDKTLSGSDQTGGVARSAMVGTVRMVYSPLSRARVIR